MADIDAAALWEAAAEGWTRDVRRGYDVYRDRYNTPAFVAFLPPVTGLRVLDIGCGEGENTRTLARLGARMSAVDVAPTFVRHARASEEAAPLGIDYRVADAARLPFADASFDAAVAFMSFMDIAGIASALREAHRVVRPGGFLQFSILHPCFTGPHRRVLRDEHRIAYAIEVARYFEREPKVQQWSFSDGNPADRAQFRLVEFHRPLSDWVALLVDAGWTIEAMNEPTVDDETAAAHPVVQDTQVAPLVLQVRVRRSLSP